MPLPDIFLVLRWWGGLFLVGAAAYPLTKRLFFAWHDQGYLFSKAVGMATISWIVYVLGMTRVAPFHVGTIVVAAGVVFVGGLLSKGPRGTQGTKGWNTIITEELFFFVALLIWSWVKAHEPSIRGLEKFMDYGFMQSILNSTYFPPADMWYPPHPVNYYYFGHLVTALLTKLSGLELAYTFNLMLATIFALCFTMSFSIGKQIGLMSHIRPIGQICAGFLTAFLVTLAGNMQTLYAFTPGYSGDNVKPFWELGWSWSGFATYWYANATRFIPWTIHEFPSYSFVVSDVHGHVLSIPFVLLAIGLLIQTNRTYTSYESNKSNVFSFVFYGFLCGVLLMTNALDGPIYFGLFIITYWTYTSNKTHWSYLAAVFSAAVLTSLPFLGHFTSFVNGIAVNCPLPFFANSRIGPIIFEGVEKCQRSPVWMLWLLWGFFVYCGISLIGHIRHMRHMRPIENILLIFFVFSLLLLIFPEFFYFKDIYPQHFRSNTMFKLGYQAFIMLSIVSAYAIMTVKNKVFYVLLVPQLFLVSIYPYFSVRSYFGGLKNYEGLYGFTWVTREYPENFQAMLWFKGQPSGAIVEADGDSYTDYNQFSVFTGRPTIVGWAVHEWLWRGSYDVVSPRREDVRKIYESEDVEETKDLLDRYQVRYVIVGKLEREKFMALNEAKLVSLGYEAFRSGKTVVYGVIDK